MKRILVVLTVLTAGLTVASAQPAFAAPAWKIAAAPSPPGPPLGTLLGVSCASATNCFAVGIAEDGKSAGMAQRWNGTSWSVQTVPLPAGATAGGLNAVSCKSGGPCFAVGYADTSSGGKSFATRWDGASWSTTPTPNPAGATGTELDGVSCLSAGPCVAVGDYHAGGKIKPLAERWNGATWSMLSVPLPSSITQGQLVAVSCASATNCKAVGQYFPGSGSKSLVERWDGATWVPVSHPMPAGATGNALYAVSCPSPTFCEAVGESESAMPDANFVERWNGSAWSIVTVPNRPGTENRLVAVSCVSSSACVAAGSFSGFPKTLVESWNGSTWKIVASSTPGVGAELNAVSCATTTACFAGGQTDVGQFVLQGTSFSIAASPTTSSESVLRDVACPSSASCVAVGDSFDGARFKTLVERWSGSAWSITPSPNPAGSVSSVLGGVSCSGATFCIAVGQTAAAGAESSAFVERWNGSVWSLVSTPSVAADSSQLASVSCVNTSSCIAVGSARISSATHGLVERWNGSSWSVSMPPEPGGAAAASLYGVSCHSASACIAVGNYFAGSTKTWVERWNGSSWSVVASPNPSSSNGALESVSCTSATSCMAVGQYFSSHTKTFAERWTGGAWSIVSSPNVASSPVDTLSDVSCVSASSCFAVGQAGVGNTSGPLIEHWNGTKWSVKASPQISGYQGQLSGVKCMSSTSCVAVGVNRTVGDFTLVERYS